MQTITLDILNNLNPPGCYKLERFISPEWKGSLNDFLDIEHIPFEYRLWVVLKYLNKQNIISFSNACYEQFQRMFFERKLKQFLIEQENEEIPAFAKAVINSESCFRFYRLENYSSDSLIQEQTNLLKELIKKENNNDSRSK